MPRFGVGEGLWTWHDAVAGEDIEAEIVSVGPMGHLTLRLADGTERSYAFKEIAAIL